MKGKIDRDGKFGLGSCKHQEVHPEELAHDIKRVRENIKGKKAYYNILMEQHLERMNAQIRRDYHLENGIPLK